MSKISSWAVEIKTERGVNKINPNSIKLVVNGNAVALTVNEHLVTAPWRLYNGGRMIEGNGW